MAISVQLNRQLHDVFLNRGAIQFPDYIRPNLAFENNNVFNLFLRVEISGPEIDVPLMCKYKVEEGLLSNYNYPNSLKEDEPKLLLLMAYLVAPETAFH